MTTMETRRAGAALPSPAIRARDLLSSEWTKLRSVRSTYWTLLVAVVTAIGLSAIVALALTTTLPAGQPQIDPLLPGFASLEYAVLAVGVLGALAFTSEHATALIRTTFAAVPRRRAVLAAKAAVVGTVTLTVGELVSFASFLLSQAILSSNHLGTSQSHAGVPGAVLADGLLRVLGPGQGVDAPPKVGCPAVSGPGLLRPHRTVTATVDRPLDDDDHSWLYDCGRCLAARFASRAPGHCR